MVLLRTLGDQQILAALSCIEQRIRHAHVQPPGNTHATAHIIANDESGTVEVQPHLPRERQLIVGAHNAAAALVNRQRVTRGDAIRGELPPAGGHVCLIRIHRRQPLRRGHAQRVVRLVAPDFGIGKIAFGVGQR